MRRGIWRGLIALTMLAMGLNHSGAAQDTDCTCAERLSRPKTYEQNCEGPHSGRISHPNTGCDPMEVPELCADKPADVSTIA